MTEPYDPSDNENVRRWLFPPLGLAFMALGGAYADVHYGTIGLLAVALISLALITTGLYPGRGA